MSLSFSSGPLSPSSSIHKTNHLTIDLSRAGTWNQCKSCVKGHYLSLHLSLPNFQENWMAMEKLGISFWKKIHHYHLSYFYLQGFYIATTATMIFKLTYTILHWRGQKFFWNHFLKELRNQAQLSSQAYWICAQAFSCLRDLFCHTREYKELRRVVNTSSNF